MRLLELLQTDSRTKHNDLFVGEPVFYAKPSISPFMISIFSL